MKLSAVVNGSCAETGSAIRTLNMESHHFGQGDRLSAIAKCALSMKLNFFLGRGMKCDSIAWDQPTVLIDRVG